MSASYLEVSLARSRKSFMPVVQPPSVSIEMTDISVDNICVKFNAAKNEFVIDDIVNVAGKNFKLKYGFDVVSVKIIDKICVEVNIDSLKSTFAEDHFTIGHDVNGKTLLNFYINKMHRNHRSKFEVPRLQFEINCNCCRHKAEWVRDCGLKIINQGM